MKKRNVMYMGLLCAALAACGALPSQQGAQVGNSGAAAQPVSGTWFSPPSDFPGICMHFSPDGAQQNAGALKFSGGFEFFNPARWQHDAASSELRIELGGSEDFPAPVEAAKPLMQNQGALLRFDAAKRSLTYRLAPSTDMIDVGGFKFYRNRACVAEK
jgi:hypothetical protein